MDISNLSGFGGIVSKFACSLSATNSGSDSVEWSTQLTLKRPRTNLVEKLNFGSLILIGFGNNSSILVKFIYSES